MRNYFPLEETARDEADNLYSQWNQGCYKFLLQRTADHYDRLVTTKRRTEVQSILNQSLPKLNDQMLSYLYAYTSQKFSKHCFQAYEHSGFHITTTEKNFASSLTSVLKEVHGTDNLEIYPNIAGPVFNSRMLIGVHVPDFLFFGIKQKGFAAIAIEIDGDAHIHKTKKDFQKYQNLESLGILTLSIPTERVHDLTFIRELLNSLKQKRTKAFIQQIAYTKRKIWCKTISCHLTLYEIEILVKNKFNEDLGLSAEAKIVTQLECCPRDIQRELRRTK